MLLLKYIKRWNQLIWPNRLEEASMTGHPVCIPKKSPISQEKSMNRKTFRTITFRSFALVVLLGAAWQAQAQDSKAPYPSMAPLDQYLMERNAEIALARSAAPESISHDAEGMALGGPGYGTPATGKNGFVRIVCGSGAPGFANPEL